jgi:hypothetical protein
MKSWRTVALVLAVVCCYQRYRSCTAPAPEATTTTTTTTTTIDHTVESRPTPAPSLPWTGKATPDAPARTFHGFKVPMWAAALAPQPGEKMRDYRDRMLPLIETAIAPQRARVAKTRDDFAILDPRQRAELDAAVKDTAAKIEERIANAIVSGELRPQTFKPMTGISLAREILDLVERGNTRFLDSLTPDQRARLATHRFDFADYLLFSARWEDALHALD